MTTGITPEQGAAIGDPPRGRGFAVDARRIDTEVEISLGRGSDATLGRLARWVGDVPGRGACGLPDGAVRLLRSALEVFGADVRAHLRGRRCEGSRCPRTLPVPQPGEAA